MPKLIAPDLPGLSYNSMKIQPGSEVDVLDQDVEDLLAARWKRGSVASPMAPAPELEIESDDDYGDE